MKYLGVSLWIAGLSYLLALSSHKTYETSKNRYELVSPPPLAELKKSHTDILILGFRPLYDDILNLWSLQFLSDENLKNQDPSKVFDTMMKVARQRPYFESLYMYACFILAFDFKRPENCESILMEGLEAVPGSWRIPLTQGFISAFLLKNFAKSGAYYNLASSKPGAPPYIKNLAEKMLVNNTSTPEELLESLSITIKEDSDPRFREMIIQKLKNHAEQTSPEGGF